jgi:hypothetical protein
MKKEAGVLRDVAIDCADSTNQPARQFVHVLVYVNQIGNFRVDPNYFSVPFLPDAPLTAAQRGTLG